MRIGIFSDVHTECFLDGGWPEFFKHLPYDKMDALVLAGDILECTDLKKFMLVFERICKKTQVVYVPGNHEYWHTNKTPQQVWEEVIYPGMDRLKDRLFVLYTGKSVLLHGKTFCGDTMWFPDAPDARTRLRAWPEARLIKDYVPWVFEQNRKWNKSTKMDIREGDIVVTHHAPSFQSTPVRFKGDGFNSFYVDGGMESVILKKKPKLWIHGHTHDPFDYNIAETRIICNPRGVPGQDTGFDPGLVVEV